MDAGDLAPRAPRAVHLSTVESVPLSPENRAELATVAKTIFEAVRRYALKADLSEADAEDVAQDAVVAVYIKVAQERRLIKSPLAYGITCARNKIKSNYRKTGREVSTAEPGESIEPAASWAPDAQELRTIGEVELARVVEFLAEKLTPRQFEVYFLRHVYDLTYKQIATLLDMSVGNVGGHLSRAGAQLLLHRGQARQRLG